MNEPNRTNPNPTQPNDSDIDDDDDDDDIYNVLKCHWFLKLGIFAKCAHHEIKRKFSVLFGFSFQILNSKFESTKENGLNE